jgi:hypothetical protein
MHGPPFTTAGFFFWGPPEHLESGTALAFFLTMTSPQPAKPEKARRPQI